MNENEDQAKIVLNDSDWEKFNKALDAPAEPNEALKKFLACPDGWDVPPEDDMEWLPSATAGETPARE